MQIRVTYHTSLSHDESNAQHHDHNGQECVIEPLDPNTYDVSEAGPMFKAVFTDGWTTDVFEDELLFEGDGTDV